MTHLRSGWRRLAAVSIGLSVALGFLPGAVGAASAQDPGPGAVSTSGPALSYVVNTKGTSAGTLKSVREAAEKAGGSIVTTYAKIGVIVVHAGDTGFAQKMRTTPGVASAGATRTAPLEPNWTTSEGGPQPYKKAAVASATAEAAPGQEPLEPDQWDLRAIRSDQANKISQGSSKLTVGVIDTGTDDTHPDLAPNFSKSQSANCVGGVADTSDGAWRPYDSSAYHGTHTAGEIAAARNGIGVAGVAPGVKIAAIKVSEPGTQLFYPESVVCAFVFAADHGIDVTNNSYYVDPWLYNCKDDPDQRAIVDAVGRAASYAEGKGIVNVASAGNSNDDLASDKLTDASSPDDSDTPVTRTVDPSKCFDVPTQLPGVVTVSATGVQNQTATYSSYGYRVVDVAAPGGDRFQVPTDTPSQNGRVLSTMPDGQYAWLSGTSMAAPHTAGVVALIKTRHPEATPGAVQNMLKAQADNPGCPEFYDPDGNGVEDSKCTGPKAVNGFYGSGVVDALDAVTK
jgi:subtilisin family serine protease